MARCVMCNCDRNLRLGLDTCERCGPAADDIDLKVSKRYQAEYLEKVPQNPGEAQKRTDMKSFMEALNSRIQAPNAARTIAP